jgi:hypothetical protein
MADAKIHNRVGVLGPNQVDASSSIDLLAQMRGKQADDVPRGRRELTTAAPRGETTVVRQQYICAGQSVEIVVRVPEPQTDLAVALLGKLTTAAEVAGGVSVPAQIATDVREQLRLAVEVTPSRERQLVNTECCADGLLPFKEDVDAWAKAGRVPQEDSWGHCSFFESVASHAARVAWGEADEATRGEEPAPVYTDQEVGLPPEVPSLEIFVEVLIEFQVQLRTKNATLTCLRDMSRRIAALTPSGIVLTRAQLLLNMEYLLDWTAPYRRLVQDEGWSVWEACTLAEPDRAADRAAAEKLWQVKLGTDGLQMLGEECVLMFEKVMDRADEGEFREQRSQAVGQPSSYVSLCTFLGRSCYVPIDAAMPDVEANRKISGSKQAHEITTDALIKKMQVRLRCPA